MVWTSTIEFDSLSFHLQLENDPNYNPVSKFSSIAKEDQKGLSGGQLAFYSILVKHQEHLFYFPGVILPANEEELTEEYHYLLERFLLPKTIRYLQSLKNNQLAQWIK